MNQRYVKTIGIVDFSCVPLAETVGADALKPQIVAYDFQLLLDCPLCDGEDQVCAFDPISQAVVLNVLPNQERDCENPAFACFLLHDLQAVAISIPHDVAGSQFDDVADPQPQVPLQDQRCAILSLGRQPQNPSFTVCIISLYCSAVRAFVFLFIVASKSNSSYL